MKPGPPNPPAENPLDRFVQDQGVCVFDGGLATTLEARGHDLNDTLWSARFLLEDPTAIRDVHRDFLAAGADCITTATYQASLPGFAARGLDQAGGIEMMRRALSLANEARTMFWDVPANRTDRRYPLVAASAGPYGAYLADGSEYSGQYGITADQLYAFHQPRWQVLTAGDADLIACETIPSHQEAEVLLQLLRETQQSWAWLSFSCRDGEHLCDGSPFAEVVRLCDREPQVAAVGINCTAPEFVSSLIGNARQATTKPVIVYPNSGEQYDGISKEWQPSATRFDFLAAAQQWHRLGAVGIGGCCRVGPEQIAELRRRLIQTK